MKTDKPATNLPYFIENKAYTLSDMAALYKVSRYTFQCWIRPFLKELGEMRRTLTPKQVRIIFEKLDYPLDF